MTMKVISLSTRSDNARFKHVRTIVAAVGIFVATCPFIRTVISADETTRSPTNSTRRSTAGPLDELLFGHDEANSEDRTTAADDRAGGDHPAMVDKRLTAIHDQMIRARLALNTGDVKAAMDLQQQVLQSLQAMVRDASSDASAGGQSSRTSADRSRTIDGENGGPQRADAGGIGPRKSPSPGESNEVARTAARRDQLLDRMWGHLPEVARHQMLSTAGTEFLPKYETQIEEYFLLLSKRLQDTPRTKSGQEE
jgi:hypothetical protein